MNYRLCLIASGVPADTATAFIDYHKANPGVWDRFELKALALINRGVKRYGAKAIFEVIRYEHMLAMGPDSFVVNNNWAAYYARIFAIKHAKHDGCAEFFEFREVHGLREAA